MYPFTFNVFLPYITVFNVTAAKNTIGTGLIDLIALLAFKKDHDKHHAKSYIYQ